MIIIIEKVIMITILIFVSKILLKESIEKGGKKYNNYNDKMINLMHFP